MKKYFCKFLPVEGEIKEAKSPHVNDGDFYIDREGKIYRNGWKGISPPVDIFKFKKAKLFLCSRDIQVGDKVRSFNYPEQEEREVINLRVSKKMVGKDTHSEIYHLADIQYPNEIGTAAVSQFFKVIGEISPDATWVQEGDEFDEDEVQECIGQPHSKQAIPVIEPWKSKILKDKPECFIVFKIKGQCGHFH